MFDDRRVATDLVFAKSPSSGGGASGGVASAGGLSPIFSSSDGGSSDRAKEGEGGCGENQLAYDSGGDEDDEDDGIDNEDLEPISKEQEQEAVNDLSRWIDQRKQEDETLEILLGSGFV